jgi:hypothetical protein
MEKQIYKSTINGSIAGGLGYILTLPLDAIKQNIQTGNKIVEKNIKNYFRGGILGVTTIILQMAIKFTSNILLRIFIKKMVLMDFLKITKYFI